MWLPWSNKLKTTALNDNIFIIKFVKTSPVAHRIKRKWRFPQKRNYKS